MATPPPQPESLQPEPGDPSRSGHDGGGSGGGIERSKLHRQRTSRRRLIADRAAGWAVTAGGMAIIASILGILLFILVEVWPLTRDARVAVVDRFNQPAAGAAAGSTSEESAAATVAPPHDTLDAAVVDEHRTHLAGLGADGVARVVRLADDAVVETVDLVGLAGRRADGAGTEETDGGGRPEVVGVAARPDPSHPLLSAALADGRVLVAPVAFPVRFEGQQRRVGVEIGEPVVFDLAPPAPQQPPAPTRTGAESTEAPSALPLRAWAATLDGDGNGAAAGQLADGRLVLVRRSVRKSFLSDTVQETFERASVPVSYPLSSLVVDRRITHLYAGTPGGELLWWQVGHDGPESLQVVSAGRAAVTALGLLIGDRSLVVGQADGALAIWFPVESERGEAGERLTRIRTFPSQKAAVAHIEPSPRNKGFLALCGDHLGLYYSTSDRVLWQGEAPVEHPRGLAFAPKANGAYVLGESSIAGVSIDAPHPEITWKTLFGKVWYEGYDHPEWVWQSSSGTDDFEPKLSLTPLLVGTLKGTFYSLLVAIPLAIFGAMYLSHFMHPAYKRYVKPVIEIMASLPSVVLGFLAGLWLAPRLEQWLPAVFLMLVVLPLTVLATGGLWSLLPRRVRNRVPTGSEMFVFAVTLGLGIWLCLALEGPIEHWVFAGDFQTWLRETTGLPFDQRNAIVVGIAMGFAVIPIIFAISEDAFANVPPNLVAGSLALGANRWQTATRVVLPTASPGIFSAVMVGFGRAIGETMIVLMATGNTPIMDWNPFNGFRTLSANIAVEIPEAPQGGTLYRTLFLAALLLFVLTFVVNTVSELVRHRLRQRFSKL